MAVSDDEKVLQRGLLSISVYELRQRLGKTQAQFAEMLGDDSMTISRWERKVLAPRPRTRKRLSRIAREHGWADLAAVFDAPIEHWRSIVLSAGDRQLLALFEIVLLNKPLGPYQVGQVIPFRESSALMRSMNRMVRELERVARARKPVALIGPEQAAAWSALTDPRARELFKRDWPPGLMVAWCNDGRIEIIRGGSKC
jgi:transcriptional regulator with XRE-family HTH domain